VDSSGPGTRQSRRRILIVEDNAELSFGLQMNLEIEGYEVLVEGDGAQALTLLESFRPDLIILDIMLPGLDGFQLLKHWRERDDDTRVLVLSAKGAETDRVTAFRLGADDYVTKPFSLLELLERIKRQLYRLDAAGERDATIVLGSARIDFAARTVTRDGVVTQLPPKEFALLSALLDARGSVLTKSAILATVWGHRAAVRTNTVEYHLSALRRKIEDDPRHPKHILTVTKAGYRLQL
jgi:DNA-binding response OmpR family regulator